MNHERFHELLALRLYDELDPAEAAALETHLDACAPCRAFAAELNEGLARAPRGESSDELPPGWVEALHARVDALPRPAARRGSILPFAAGLAAGLLVMAGWRALANEATTTATPTGATAAPEVAVSFARTTPPPPASGRGPLAQLAALGRRR